MTRKVHEGKTTEGAPADRVFEPGGSVKMEYLGEAPADGVLLTGELAAAYAEFQAAAADLEGKVKAADDAKMRFQAALGKFTRLSTGAGAKAP